MDTPKEISEYLMKTGARVPKVKPGRQTIKCLGEVQQSSRFWGELCYFDFYFCMKYLISQTSLKFLNSDSVIVRD